MRWSGIGSFGFAILVLLGFVAAAPAPEAAPPAKPAASAVAPAPAAWVSQPPKNLKVLPKDWTRGRVVEVMKTWTADLGIRCWYCHVGSEEKPLSEYDFPSDEKDTKRRAREMVQLLAEVNRRLGEMSNLHDGGPSLQATCGTCHRGVPRPRRIEDVFEETRAKDGL